MKTIKYLSAILLSVAFISCDSFLDVKPRGYTIPEEIQDYEKLLNHQSLYVSLDGYTSYITDDALFADDGGDPSGNFDFITQKESVKRLYRFDKGQVFTPGETDNIWDGSYSRIFVYNAVINNALKSKGGTETEKKRLWAEALVGRAFEYLTLVNIYSKHYDSQTAQTDLGVPLVLSEEFTTVFNRNSVAQVYEQIKQDLADAVPNLSERVSHSFRPDQSIGYAFLAKMYLYMGDYNNALVNANQALKKNSVLVDYKLYTTKPGQWGRIILASDKTKLFPDKHNNPENIYTRLLKNTAYLFKNICASKELVDLYNQNLQPTGKDMRFELFYGNGKYDPGSGSLTFPGYAMFAPYVEINVGFSTPEIYLIAAECEARVGSLDAAIGYLNTLRNMRILNNKQYDVKDYSKDQILKLVFDERRRELAFCGASRLIDLKRLGKEPLFAKSVVHKADGQVWELPANDPRLIMPVPEKVLSYNVSMPQYDR